MKSLLVIPFAALFFSITSCAHNIPIPNNSQPWIQTELFFGLSQPDGALVSEAQWQQFADELSATFPDGLTILPATGQYFETLQGRRTLHHEPSRLVIIGYPKSQAAHADTRIQTICQRYVLRFHQDSVLRLDTPAQASFIIQSRAPHDAHQISPPLPNNIDAP